MRKPIPYGRQFVSQADKHAVMEVLGSDFLTTGPLVDEFESKFADYVGSKYAVAVSNGTAALHLCALALGVDENSQVITTPITFAASANCIRYCGGKLKFIDIQADNLLIDLDILEACLKENPSGTFSGVVSVDFAGYPVDLERLRRICDEHKLWIIEDSCHAPGGYFTDSTGIKQSCGNGQFADLAIFSFHPVKHIACGEGGMITTDEPDLYASLKRLRSHGITRDPVLLNENHGGWYYEMIELGYNYRIPDILCALGISQLSRAEINLNRRREIAEIYDRAFSNLPVDIHKPKSKQIGHAYHLYVIEVEDRKGLYDYLRENQIHAQVHYVPVHTLPYYHSLGYEKGIAPVAEKYYSRCISLPMYPSLKNEEQDYVIQKVNDFFK